MGSAHAYGIKAVLGEGAGRGVALFRNEDPGVQPPVIIGKCGRKTVHYDAFGLKGEH